ncbi:hypothetical protein DEU56DRAFT_752138 [Suillus clintonianus]|uniref:uncharacterized protein n=1 Tax=Suillus clintonianus TaxID=1904413 RepID=UPI001B87B595|nr:uncharacterized protein DEU56DRAFT_753356 [Suillus clintonianus]XP_041213486.1 uncharacterized protein DEU56DRAFT_752138 [Suillus clintonianus]KAG2148134.1 hypothetical protein DEU56DRAFT_753356 [Suillus clintonianus]KAG2152852.1 hypothetical protein DEU56DRAFT_752138 [Suillus clintonianus]
MALIALQPTLTLLHSFADRDTFARFAGIGVGHEVQYTSSAIRQHSSKYRDDSFSCGDESSDEEDTVEDGDAKEGDVQEGDVQEDDGESDGGEDSNSTDDEPEESDSDGEEDGSDDDDNLYRF